MPKSTYLANKILDHMNGGGDYTRPATTYFALCTSAPTPAGIGAGEVTTFGAARLAYTNNGTNWPSASAGGKVNGTLMDWGTASGGAWGTITHIAEMDASSGGNLLKYGALTTPITVNSGQGFQVVAGGASLTET